MDEIKNMLRGVINAQSALREELLERISKLDMKLSGRMDSLEEKMDKGFKKVDSRLDTIGKSVAYLEDDTPTRVEHRKLEKRVTKIEKKLQMQPAI